MIPFPRQEMQRLKWTPVLIEYFYQLHLVLEALTGANADDDDGGLLSNILLSSLRSQIRDLQDEVADMEAPASTATNRDDPEAESHSLWLRMRSLEVRLSDIEDEIS